LQLDKEDNMESEPHFKALVFEEDLLTMETKRRGRSSKRSCSKQKRRLRMLMKTMRCLASQRKKMIDNI
jgi:hypothetical protein